MKKNRKTTFLLLIFLILIFFLSEISSYFFIKKYDFLIEKQNLFAFKYLNKRHGEILLNSLTMNSALLDPDLGFDSNTGIIRGYTGLPLGKQYFASTYGDSFVYCYEVPFQHSWQYLAEKKLEKKVLNLGVSEYGLDQAYLKFLKYYKTYPTDIVVLGFLTHTFPRLITTMEDMDYKLPKPRFFIDKNKIKLYKNSFIKAPKDLMLLEKYEVLSKIFEYDGAYNYLNKYRGINLLEPRQFPYVFELARVCKSKWYSYKNNIKDFISYMEKSEKINSIIKYIIDEFIEKSKEFNFSPIFLINCDISDLNKEYELNFEHHIKYMKSKNIITIEVKKIFQQILKKKKLKIKDLYTSSNGHYSYTGNLLISQAMTNVLRAFKIKENYNKINKKVNELMLITPNYNEINKKVKMGLFYEKSFADETKIFSGEPLNTKIGIDKIHPNKLMQIDKSKSLISAAKKFLSEKKFNSAIQHYREAFELTPEWIELYNELAWALATTPEDFKKYEGEAIYLAGLACEASRNLNPEHLDTLAAAYAKNYKFKDAAGIAEIAYKVAIKAGNLKLAEKIKKRKLLYKNNKFYIGSR